MKIIILNTFELSGGAAIAAIRLMEALRKFGVEARMLVRDKQTDNINVISVNRSFFGKRVNRLRFLWERFVIFVYNRFSRKNIFAVSIANTGTDISKHPEIKKADIIHLHWINQGFLSIKDINKLIQTGKPIIWTMHDMWPCTGICHYARTCDSFSRECGECFFLESKNKRDLSRRAFFKKKKLIYSNSITLVPCSNWLAVKAQMSNLTKKQKISLIPNPIDIVLFNITDKLSARKMMKLPMDKKLILFGAANLTDKRKGINYLIEALNYLKTSNSEIDEKLCLVVFGQAKSEFETQIKMPVYSMGYLNSTEDIVSLYNAVDVFVTSSLEDNLPNTIMEAMACGTPCVGFNTGGIPEMIEHKENGYIAGYKDANDLAEGINWVLNEADYKVISTKAREKVVNNYSEEVVSKQYIELYKSLLY